MLNNCYSKVAPYFTLVLLFSWNFVVINASEESLFFQILYFTTACVKCRVGVVKSYPVLHFSIVTFSAPLVSLISALWELSTARSHEWRWTFTLSLMYRHISCNFVVIYASEGSFFLHFFISNKKLKIVKIQM
jgi:hypothetical protein